FRDVTPPVARYTCVLCHTTSFAVQHRTSLARTSPLHMKTSHRNSFLTPSGSVGDTCHAAEAENRISSPSIRIHLATPVWGGPIPGVALIRPTQSTKSTIWQVWALS